MLKNFTVDQRSQFSLNNGQRINRGSWRPTFYTYFDTSFEGRTHRWLVVSFHRYPRIQIEGKIYDLVLKPVDCEIKGMESLEEQCVAKKLYKILS